jgi:hypothetical protein
MDRVLFDRTASAPDSAFGSRRIVSIQTSSMSRTQHPIDLFEEAIHLLRRAPIETYAFFLTGITPFILCLFNFCSEMSYSELAAANLPVYAFGLGLSYAWMKGFQHLACRTLFRTYSGESLDNEKFGTVLRACFSQAAFHPIGLFVKPMAAIASIPGYLTFVPQLMLPALVTFAFFQNASVLITGERGDFEKCWQLTANRVRATAALSLLLIFLRIVVFLNVFTTIGTLPYLLKALFGIDTFLSRDFRWLMSFTYLVGTVLISYFAVDLLIKAIHVIRICQAQALTSGKDLKRSLLALAAAKSVNSFSPLLLLVVCYFTLPTVAHGRSLQPTVPDSFVQVSLKRVSPPEDSNRIPESEFNEQIDRELSGSEYNWRKPQHHVTSAGADWLRNVGAWINRTGHRISRAIDRFAQALQKWWKSLFPSPQESIPSSTQASIPAWISQVLVLATIGGLFIAAALVAVRLFGRSKPKLPVPAVSPVSPLPDLKSESTVADELPEDQWLLLARNKLQEGELRLALRALFLAVLALLGAQRVIIIRRSKSNSDYESELRKRKQAELAELFRGNRRLFERCWYGDDPVTEIEIEESNQFYQRLKHVCLTEK